MPRKNQPGFTLIELLVVIAIIGTLSSIVISSLNTARSKATDVAIKQSLSQMPAAIEAGRLEGQAAKVEYGLACSTTPSTYGGNGGGLFASAVSKSDHQAGAGICTAASEPSLAPPYSGAIGGLRVVYSVNASGGIVRTTSALGPPNSVAPFWAAAVRLSTGEYFCVSQLDSPVVTATLTVGAGDYSC